MERKWKPLLTWQIMPGLVVAKVGTSTVTISELQKNYHVIPNIMGKSQILKLNEAKNHREKWREDNQKVVFTNGCFDILHAGHVTYLNEAKSLGDKLIIGLNSDQSVKTLKGKSRPIIKEEHRAILLASLEIVDMVVMFEESTPIELITQLKPDIHVKGGDYEKGSS